MIRAGSGPPLILLHGVLGSAHHWQGVVPLLSGDFDVVATDALGHRGGTASEDGIGIRELCDEAERQMDELGLEKAHLAGNSMGGWMSLELARRGRALSVCALSPAGSLIHGEPDQVKAEKNLRRTVKDAHRLKAVAPFLLRFRPLRRFALRLAAEHGDATTREMLLELGEDTRACTVYNTFFKRQDQLPVIDPPPCPITIAWSEHDKVLPLRSAGERYRTELVPGANFIVLEGVGHVPMFDDPQLVADTIRAAAT